jgi:hypothetical protein
MQQLLMAKRPRTTGEHIVSLYGHVTGLKKDISTIKNNHLAHMHEDIEKINEKLDNKFDSLTNLIMYGVGAVALLFIAQVLYFLSK